MTFSMSESNRSTKIIVEEEVMIDKRVRILQNIFQEEEEVVGMSEKEIEEAKKEEKEKQAKQVSLQENILLNQISLPG